MTLDNIGFYTLSDARVAGLSPTSPMKRGELILTTSCNFRCAYCRGGRVIRSDAMGDMPLERAAKVLAAWINDGLENVRFSGGEPTLHPGLASLVEAARSGGVRRIAVSSNGSADRSVYEALLRAGVNDFSISLDACCASGGNAMAGISGGWEAVVANIEWLAHRVYVTVGVVLTSDNISEALRIIEFADGLGVADIRVIPSAQDNTLPQGLAGLSAAVLARHPILNYRVGNFTSGRGARGIDDPEDSRCFIVIDDSVVAGHHHFPCVIYMREGGEPIGEIGEGMRAARIRWSREHDVYADPICRVNCLDCIVEHNRKVRGVQRGLNQL